MKCDGLSVEVSLAAAPVDGAANTELLKVLADALALPRSALRLALGKSSKHKVVEIDGLDALEVTKRLLEAAS